MKHIISFILVSLFAITASAQDIKVGYFSGDAAIKSMPEYAAVQQKINDLRAQYDNELKEAEKEFSEKYELFLEQQSKMATAIREKRQSELQLMMERNVAFRAESQRLLKQAEADEMKPLNDKLNAALAALGSANGYIIIVNTDANAVPYITPAFAVDINEEVKSELNK